jgi:hypothetical protein
VGPGSLGTLAKEWVARQIGSIDRGEVAEVITECRGLALGGEPDPWQQLAGYLENQREHLGYAEAREQSCPQEVGR